MPYKVKTLINANPLCKEIHYQGKSFLKGNPRKYNGKSREKGNPLYKETPYTRKPFTCGNSCKVKCLRKNNPKKSLINGNPL